MLLLILLLGLADRFSDSVADTLSHILELINVVAHLLLAHKLGTHHARL